MATYILLGNWTDQGMRELKNSPQRLEAAKGLAKKLGGEIKQFFMTMGGYDIVVVAEMPDDAAVARLNLQVGMGGGLRTTTLKAFPETAYRDIIASLS
jgi:uncharacterized protein with GYD domain